MKYNNDNFEEDIKNKKEEFFFYLDDFTDMYVKHKMMPNDDAVTSQYNGLVFKIDNVISSMGTLTNEINTSNCKFREKIEELDEKIKNEETINKDLIKEYRTNTNTAEGSKTLISNMKENYKRQYITNICVFLGICLEIYAIKYILS